MSAALVVGAHAQTFTVIHNFTGGEDGGAPYAGLTIDRSGQLYGTTTKGGAGYGGVYRLKHSNSGWIFSPLYNFTGGTDGAGPAARVMISPSGVLYGTTIGGGGATGCSNFLGYQGCGTVYFVRPGLSACASIRCPFQKTVVYRFTGGADGAAPWLGDVAFDAAGNVYGTASAGGQNGNGCPSGCGVAFEVTHSGNSWTESTLHSFTGSPDGYAPFGGLTFDSSGNLYGTTSAGGTANYGTVFKLTPSTSGLTENILYNFQGASDGGTAIAGLTLDNSGNLNGVTTYKGVGGGGTAFQLVPGNGSWTFNLLGGLGTGSEGPVADLVHDSVGSLYGTTWGDGSFGYGTVFKLTNSGGTWTYSVIHEFTGGQDGGNPASTLVVDSTDKVYGTTSIGGSRSSGTVFELTPVAPGPAFPIKASANDRYLIDQSGAPFLLVGDAPHTMFANIGLQEASDYIADRASHGFTALWCELLVNTYVGGRADGGTYDGILPFTSTLPSVYYDLTTPNPPYFARVDAMINLAASYNMVILLDSAETGGWMTTFEANGNANANSWGQYIGNRYKNFPNVIWITGNDFQTWSTSNQDNTLIENVMQGIASTDANHLQTTELNYDISGSLDDSLLVPYTSMAGAYTYYPTYYEVLKEYNSSAATVPAFLEEGFYDGVGAIGQTPTPLMLRKQAYWTVPAGGLGGYMGGTQYYDFHGGWQLGIDDVVATQLGYWSTFTHAFAWYNLVPDQTHSVVTAGYGTPSGDGTGNIQTDDYVTTGRASDGSLVESYCPESTAQILPGIMTGFWC